MGNYGWKMKHILCKQMFTVFITVWWGYTVHKTRIPGNAHMNHLEHPKTYKKLLPPIYMLYQ